MNRPVNPTKKDKIGGKWWNVRMWIIVNFHREDIVRSGPNERRRVENECCKTTSVLAIMPIEPDFCDDRNTVELKKYRRAASLPATMKCVRYQQIQR